MDGVSGRFDHGMPTPLFSGTAALLSDDPWMRFFSKALPAVILVAVLRLQEIRSLEVPALQPYRTMRRHLEHQRQGIFVAEGEKVVRRLLQSDFTVVSVLLPAKWLKDLEPILQARPEEIDVYVAEKKLLETLTGFSMYQGLLAVGRIPRPATLTSVLERSPRPYLLAAVDGITSAENLGGLVRNCAAFGAQALLVGETSSSPFLRRAVRSSMGTIFKLPVVETDDLAACLRTLQQQGIGCVAAHPHAEGKTLSQAHLTDDCCLVFGSEGCGLSPAVLAACQESVAVPMHGGVDSLNVTCAGSVFLYEAARQRGKA
jgi:tRNA G18 (ribose-2'-O)-methylase SpoU